jgi:hypothetical protein
MQEGTGSESTCALGQEIRKQRTEVKAARSAKGDAHGRIEVRSGAIAKGVDHSQNNEAKGERNPGMGDRACRYFVHDDSTGAGEN